MVKYLISLSLLFVFSSAAYSQVKSITCNLNGNNITLYPVSITDINTMNYFKERNQTVYSYDSQLSTGRYGVYIYLGNDKYDITTISFATPSYGYGEAHYINNDADPDDFKMIVLGDTLVCPNWSKINQKDK